MGSIEFRNVSKKFNDVTAVDDISMEVHDGEFLVLVGPSGCGKSTTLRLIAGLEEITSGEILIEGEPVTHLEPKDRDVAMVFQDYALFPHMTARDNMKFGMKSSTNLSKNQIREKVENAANILDIGDLLDRRPDELSGGQQQRVAIGRTIARNPEVFLMDEPLSNLDAKLRLKMRTELQELHNKLQTTTVYVTHDQTEAMTLGDRVVVMSEGRIQQVDPAQTLYDFPTNRFVAEFIGSPPMNVFPVDINWHESGVKARGSTILMDLPGAKDHVPETTEQADLGIRPEDFQIHTGGGSSTVNAIEFNVHITELLGDKLLLYGKCGEIDIQVISDDPRRAITEGDTVQLSYDAERLHLFDRRTGEAIYHSGTQIGHERSQNVTN